jgi:hypothetical protein
MLIDKIRLELLVEGGEWDTFYDLAVYLRCKYSKTATNSIKAVKKEFNRWFRWERIGASRRIRIVEIFPLPKKKEIKYNFDERNALVANALLLSSEKPIYTKRAEIIHNKKAVDFLSSVQSSKHKIEKVVITRLELFRQVDMQPVNEITKEIIETLEENKNVTAKRLQKTAWAELQNELSRILKLSLKSLKNKYLLEYYPGDIIFQNACWVLPTIEQQRLLNEAKIKALRSLGLMHTREAVLTGKYQNFINKTISLLPFGFCIANFKAAYLIVFTPEQTKEYITTVLGSVPSIEDTKELLFNLIKTSLYEANCKKYLADEADADQVIAPELKENCYTNFLQ